MKSLYIERHNSLETDIISTRCLTRQGHDCSRDIHTHITTRPPVFKSINGFKTLQTNNSRFISRTINTIWNLEEVGHFDEIYA